MKQLPKIFDLLRALIYIILGCLVLFNKQILQGLVPFAKNSLGLILLLYGIYRLYQVYIKHFSKQDDENV
jgi:hypothetical protein